MAFAPAAPSKRRCSSDPCFKLIDKERPAAERGGVSEGEPIPVHPSATGLRTRQVYLTLLIAALALWVALPFLTPVAWAAVLAIAEWPLFRRAAARWRGHPLLLSVGFALVTGLVVILPLSIAAVSLAQESQAALAWLKHAQQYGVPPPAWIGGLPLVGSRLTDWWRQHLASPEGAGALLGTISAGSALGWAQAIGGAAAKNSGLFLVTLVFLGGLLARGREIAGQTRSVADRMVGAFGRDFVARMAGAVRSTVNGTLLVSFVEGSLIGLGYLVAGVPAPLLFSVVTIVLALIPFGAWAAFGLASLILFGEGHGWAALLLFGFGVAVMTIGDNVVQPAVVGSAVELPFLMAIVGAFGGLAAMGLVGLFIGPVVMAALLLVWQEWMSPTTAREAARVQP